MTLSRVTSERLLSRIPFDEVADEIDVSMIGIYDINYMYNHVGNSIVYNLRRLHQTV